ncbi:cation diffusion facilitator family transporter [Methanobrevibacter sp.]|uniref:cation diffusion facilitator family transporter n=1 Tax=Methanobrevibacter sp. TaxID=66852 RepID=UPI00389011E5
MDEERNKVGKKASAVAIGSNCFLTVLNIVVGLTGGSYALIAEGLHTLSDVITSVIAYIGFKVGQRPADEKFTSGYGRAEAIAGLIIVMFLTLIAFEIMNTARHKLMDPETITIPDNLVLIMAAVGIILNFVISRYIIKIGKEINSPAIVADGEHQKTDIYTSVVIFIGVFVAKIGFPQMDPIIGFLIGLLILKTTYTLAKENLLAVMGGSPDDKEIVSKITEIVDGTPDASNAHNIKLDNFSSYIIVNLDVKIDGNLTLYEADKITSQIEGKISEEIDGIKSVSVKASPFEE